MSIAYYRFSLGTFCMEYEGDVLYRLRHMSELGDAAFKAVVPETGGILSKAFASEVDVSGSEADTSEVIALEKIERGADLAAGIGTPPEAKSTRSEFSDDVARQIEEYLAGQRRHFTVKCKMRGTPFQRKVWAALSAIPYGETRSYRQIAEAVGNPAACRAVGMANNKNPIQIIVPCHRVIGSNGDLVGYADGLEMKKFLLALEKENTTGAQ